MTSFGTIPFDPQANFQKKWAVWFLWASSLRFHIIRDFAFLVIWEPNPIQEQGHWNQMAAAASFAGCEQDVGLLWVQGTLVPLHWEKLQPAQ